METIMETIIGTIIVILIGLRISAVYADADPELDTMDSAVSTTSGHGGL